MNQIHSTPRDSRLAAKGILNLWFVYNMDVSFLFFIEFEENKILCCYTFYAQPMNICFRFLAKCL